MKDFIPGIVVRQKAINIWPYLGKIVERINQAADSPKCLEAIDEIIIEAAELIRKDRKEVLLRDMIDDAGPKQALEYAMNGYRYRLQTFRSAKRGLENPNLKASTKKGYSSIVKNWPRKRDEYKACIKKAASDLKAIQIDKTYRTQDGMTLKLIYGGKYPAKIERKYTNGWSVMRDVSQRAGKKAKTLTY